MRAKWSRCTAIVLAFLLALSLLGSTWASAVEASTETDVSSSAQEEKVSASTEPEPEPEPTASTEPEPEPTASTEPEPEPTASTDPEPEPTVSTDPEPEPTASTEPEPEPTASTEPEPEPTASTDPEPEPTASTDPEPEPTASTDPEPEPTASTDPEPEPTASTEPEPEVTAPKEQTVYGMEGELAVASIDGSTTVEVGSTIDLTERIQGRYSTFYHWSTTSNAVALSNTDKQTVTVTGVSAQTRAEILCTYSYKDSWYEDTYNGTDTYYVTVTEPDSYTVTFRRNGGSTAAPPSVTAEKAADYYITLPEYSGTKNGSTFAGWAENSVLESTTYYAVYPAGSQYKATQTTTLYAVWLNTNSNGEFYIRKDGTIPYEPDQYSVTEYTSAIDISNVVKSGKWICDTTGVKVEDNLTRTPTEDEIKNVLSTYDERTQYILWYVIKWSSSGSYSIWHIDGVVLNKDKLNLIYDGNSAAGDVSKVPLGSQYYSGDSVSVGHNGGNSGTVTIPVRPGYTFTEWNTRADGTGTAYQNDAVFTITENTTLYAQWSRNISQLTVTKRVAGNMGDTNIAFAFTLTLTQDGAEYTDDLIYRKTVEGGTGATNQTLRAAEGAYTFTLTGGDSITLNIPEGISYAVAEDKQDYTQTISGSGATGTIGTSASKVNFTNTKQLAPPTGVSSDQTPNGSMLVLAMSAGVLGWCMRHKRREE